MVHVHMKDLNNSSNVHFITGLLQKINKIKKEIIN